MCIRDRRIDVSVVQGVEEFGDKKRLTARLGRMKDAEESVIQ